MPIPPELVGGGSKPCRCPGIPVTWFVHAEPCGGSLLSDQIVKAGGFANTPCFRGTVESTVTESAVTADAASPPLGMHPHRQRWPLARAFMAAVPVEWAQTWDGHVMGYHGASSESTRAVGPVG